ncbi:hypothetical protein XENOCAPTIV_007517 [Xenoophorus captivus]|uniref:FLYWCH-type domain-containing protein n=1 Tax=Xenoophorus captivus TaxID=1517983 RepID=A0ABV0QH07_9TELE
MPWLAEPAKRVSLSTVKEVPYQYGLKGHSEGKKSLLKINRKRQNGVYKCQVKEHNPKCKTWVWQQQVGHKTVAITSKEHYVEISNISRNQTGSSSLGTEPLMISGR